MPPRVTAGSSSTLTSRSEYTSPALGLSLFFNVMIVSTSAELARHGHRFIGSGESFTSEAEFQLS
jgi:hypothetical protein